MKLEEIYKGITTSFPKTMRGNAPNVNHIIAKFGYERFGRGTYADLYYKVGDSVDTVLKIFSKTDLAYKAFLQFCTTHSNPFLPIIKSKVYEIPNTDYNAVKLELLQFADDQEMVRLIFSTMRYFEHNEDIEFKVKPKKDSSKQKIKSPQMEFIEKNPELAKLIKEMKPLFSMYNLDSNPDNIMIRSDGQYVITDPFKIGSGSWD